MESKFYNVVQFPKLEDIPASIRATLSSHGVSEITPFCYRYDSLLFNLSPPGVQIALTYKTNSETHPYFRFSPRLLTDYSWYRNADGFVTGSTSHITSPVDPVLNNSCIGNDVMPLSYPVSDLPEWTALGGVILAVAFFVFIYKMLKRVLF